MSILFSLLNVVVWQTFADSDACLVIGLVIGASFREREREWRQDEWKN